MEIATRPMQIGSPAQNELAEDIRARLLEAIQALADNEAGRKACREMAQVAVPRWWIDRSSVPARSMLDQWLRNRSVARPTQEEKDLQKHTRAVTWHRETGRHYPGEKRDVQATLDRLHDHFGQPGYPIGPTLQAEIKALEAHLRAQLAAASD